MEENIKYFNDKTTKRELKGQLVKELKGLGDSLKVKNKNFEGVCVESVGKDKFKMYVGPDYGYDNLTVAVLSHKKCTKSFLQIFYLSQTSILQRLMEISKSKQKVVTSFVLESTKYML